MALAGREHLDNLVFVVNCNLQRLDGPVRGNAKALQELEGRFGRRGPGALLRTRARPRPARGRPVRRELCKLRRGGHDAVKVYAAYHAAVSHQGAPSVVLAETVRSWARRSPRRPWCPYRRTSRTTSGPNPSVPGWGE